MLALIQGYTHFYQFTSSIWWHSGSVGSNVVSQQEGPQFVSLRHFSVVSCSTCAAMCILRVLWFLPQSKDMQYRWTKDIKFSVGLSVNLYVCVCMLVLWWTGLVSKVFPYLQPSQIKALFLTFLLFPNGLQCCMLHDPHLSQYQPFYMVMVCIFSLLKVSLSLSYM